jgi:LAO/AO transport system ATPase
MPDPGSLLERMRKGDRFALARLLTLVERGASLHAIAAGLPDPVRPSRVVAVTGSGGVGKSTLGGKLIEVIRAAGQTVAVLACDPRSPLTGGALLGDRFRMPSRPGDDGVFIRSLAAPPGEGAIAQHLSLMIRLLEAFGFDVVVIETVGAGQGDTAVRELADVVVLLLQPETGDDLQWEKAGVLEVANVLVIHKADLPGAGQLESQVRSILGLGKEPAPPVLPVSSRTGQGVDALWQAIRASPIRRQAHATVGRELLQLTQSLLAERFQRAEVAADPELARIVREWEKDRMTDAQAASVLWHHLDPEDRMQS